ncbi:MAG: metal ABC transporter permease [Planctomycetota bacterium]
MIAELWFNWEIDTWPLVMASLVGFACALLGTIFMLRRAALIGDAVSHSVLPGIAVGLLLAGQFTHDDEAFTVSWSMLFLLGGALVAGLLSTAVIEALHRFTRIKEDTALGAVFPAFFAAGVILVNTLARDAHFDENCIFYGSLEVISSFSQVIPTLLCAILVVLLYLCAYKELLASSFDPQYCATIGLRTRAIEYSLIAILTATVVCAFEAVGAVLVIAFLVIPPATAYLLSDRLHRVLVIAAGLGTAAGALGCWMTLALEGVGFETARAPSAALVAGAFFVLAFLFAPERGLIAQIRTRRGLRERILDENLLAAVYRVSRAEEGQSRGVALEGVREFLRYPISRLKQSAGRAMRRGELVHSADQSYALSEAGTLRVEQLVRAHRLWEIYMTSEMGAAPDHVHDAADEIEHFLQPGLVDDLDAQLDRPATDPHGKTIPTGRRDSTNEPN